MSETRIIFSQLISFVPKRDFRRLVDKYEGNKRIKSFSCWDQFLCMCFAQLTYRESLRDIEACLGAMKNKLYHVGIRSKVSRSTLGDANNSRDWRIYRDFASILIKEARTLYVSEPFGLDLKETVYALDASIITLCLSVFPWAQYQQTKGGVKLHTLIDLRGNIPVFIDITEAKVSDVRALDWFIAEAGAIYVMDRGYVDFARLFVINQALAFFITRAKKGMAYRRLYSHAVDKTCGICSDQTIKLTDKGSVKKYPNKLRRIRYFDKENSHYFVFLTNNFSLPAKTIADLYKNRWQVELFFKWIKQHLRIKKFYGTSFNAVKTQIWIAISIYVLVAIVKKKLKIDKSLYSILQVLSLTLFEKTPILQALQEEASSHATDGSDKQLNLLDS